ncbi:MAG: hypothetical protein QOJ66_3742, partial [Ilumatobacteraceae bacterium]
MVRPGTPGCHHNPPQPGIVSMGCVMVRHHKHVQPDHAARGGGRRRAKNARNRYARCHTVQPCRHTPRPAALKPGRLLSFRTFAGRARDRATRGRVPRAGRQNRHEGAAALLREIARHATQMRSSWVWVRSSAHLPCGKEPIAAIPRRKAHPSHPGIIRRRFMIMSHIEFTKALESSHAGTAVGRPLSSTLPSSWQPNRPPICGGSQRRSPPDSARRGSVGVQRGSASHRSPSAGENPLSQSARL